MTGVGSIMAAGYRPRMARRRRIAISGAVREREQSIRHVAVRLGLEIALAHAPGTRRSPIGCLRRPLDVERRAVILDRRDDRLLAEPPAMPSDPTPPMARESGCGETRFVRVTQSTRITIRLGDVGARWWVSIANHGKHTRHPSVESRESLRFAGIWSGPLHGAEGVVVAAERSELLIAAEAPRAPAVEPVRVELACLAISSLERADPVVPADQHQRGVVL